MNIFSNDFKRLNLDFTIYIDYRSNEECQDLSIRIKDVSEQILADYDAVIESTYIYITEYDTSEIEEDYREGETKVTRHLMLPRNRYGIEELSSSLKVKDIRLLDEKKDKTLVIELGGRRYYDIIHVEVDLCLFLDEFISNMYVNSMDARKHLMDIRYYSNTVEQAWLIYQCERLTLQEKHEAWKYLMECEDDMPLKLSDDNEIDNISLYNFLVRYMKMEDDRMERLLDSKNSLYQFSLRFTKQGDSSDFFEDYCLYYSYGECLEAAKQSVEKYADQALKYVKVRIRRRDRNNLNDNTYIDAYLNADYKITEIYSDGCNDEELEINGIFEKMWLSFHAPFKNAILFPK